MHNMYWKFLWCIILEICQQWRNFLWKTPNVYKVMHVLVLKLPPPHVTGQFVYSLQSAQEAQDPVLHALVWMVASEPRPAISPQSVATDDEQDRVLLITDEVSFSKKGFLKYCWTSVNFFIILGQGSSRYDWLNIQDSMLSISVACNWGNKKKMSLCNVILEIETLWDLDIG